MLAAVTAVAYHVSASVKAEGWLASVFPFPVVLSGGRWGMICSRNTLCLTALLLACVAGPVRSSSYTLTHGITGLAIAICWSSNLHWALSIPLSALARSAGTLLSICLTSALIRANLLRLVLTQTRSLIDRISPSLQPSDATIALAMVVALFLNCIISCFLLHVIFCALTSTSSVPQSYANPPRAIRRALFNSS
jgi:hypothetical protein